MGRPARLRRIFLAAALTACAGCLHRSPTVAPQPSPTSKIDPAPAPSEPPAPAPVGPAATPRPPPPVPTALSSGPWTACTAAEASVAIAVTVRTGGVFRERTAVHYLKPASPTRLRLVRRTAGAPVLLDQHDIPQACSSSVHLCNDEAVWTGTQYAVHSVLKQTPVDPSQAVTLDLGVQWHNDGDEHRFARTQTLNGLSHAELGDGRVAVEIRVLTPSEASGLDQPAPPPDATTIPRCLAWLQSWGGSFSLVTGPGALDGQLPARFVRGPSGLCGERLHLYPNHTYSYARLGGPEPQGPDYSGRWSLSAGLLSLESPPAPDPDAAEPPDRCFLLLSPAEATPSGRPDLVLLGTGDGLSRLLPPPGRRDPDFQRALAGCGFTLTRDNPPEPDPHSRDATPARDDPAPWNRLAARFHLSFHRESRNGSGFVLDGGASVEFADVRFNASRIDINGSLSELRLSGPVEIEWAGRRFSASDTDIHVTDDRIQAEADSIEALEP